MPKPNNKAVKPRWLPVVATALTLLFSASSAPLRPAAADAGDPKILMKQAAMYLYGHGVEADAGKAIERYRAVAEQGVAFAQYRLARIYLDGEHVERDVEKALTWLHRAAGLGFVEAQLELSRLYETAEDVEADYVSAWIWLHIAGSLGELDIEARQQTLEEKMSFLQLTRAQYLARRCVYRGYKNC